MSRESLGASGPRGRTTSAQRFLSAPSSCRRGSDPGSTPGLGTRVAWPPSSNSQRLRRSDDLGESSSLPGSPRQPRSSLGAASGLWGRGEQDVGSDTGGWGRAPVGAGRGHPRRRLRRSLDADELRAGRDT